MSKPQKKSLFIAEYTKDPLQDLSCGLQKRESSETPSCSPGEGKVHLITKLIKLLKGYFNIHLKEVTRFVKERKTLRISLLPEIFNF